MEEAPLSVFKIHSQIIPYKYRQLSLTLRSRTLTSGVPCSERSGINIYASYNWFSRTGHVFVLRAYFVGKHQNDVTGCREHAITCTADYIGNYRVVQAITRTAQCFTIATWDSLAFDASVIAQL